MEKSKNLTALKIIAVIAFLLMVAVNALANLLPINGITTGEVSNSYPNLFTPAPLTFSIWGLIYILLALFVLYVLGIFKKGYRTDVIRDIGVFLIISCFANAGWIFAWHYGNIILSVILMAAIFILLMVIFLKLMRADLALREKFFMRLPFEVYFGWITIATIANITVLLVSLNWNGFFISDEVWMLIIVAAGFLIGALVTVVEKSMAYGLVIIFAYAGILIRHLSENGFNKMYSEVYIAVIAAMVLMSGAVIFAGLTKAKHWRTK